MRVLCTLIICLKLSKFQLIKFDVSVQIHCIYCEFMKNTRFFASDWILLSLLQFNRFPRVSTGFLRGNRRLDHINTKLPISTSTTPKFGWTFGGCGGTNSFKCPNISIVCCASSRRSWRKLRDNVEHVFWWSSETDWVCPSSNNWHVSTISRT